MSMHHNGVIFWKLQQHFSYARKKMGKKSNVNYFPQLVDALAITGLTHLSQTSYSYIDL